MTYTRLCVTCNKPTGKNTKKYCDKCKPPIFTKTEKPLTECFHCKKLTTNPRYCSQTCSATSTNKLYPKKKKTKFYQCSICGKPVAKAKIKLCASCRGYKYENWDTVTLGEIKAKRKYQKHVRVREKARELYKKANLPRQCKVCGYDKHVEICHIKPISSFSESSTIAEINSLDNLIALCPNHHIELDKGLLSLTCVVT